MKVIRFDQAFFNAKPQDLNALKNKFPDFFDPNTPDDFWIEKNQNKDWRSLYQETQKKFADFTAYQNQLQNHLCSR